MTTSPLTRKISTFSLSKGFFVVANKVGGIVTVLNVGPSILFRSIPGLANEIFNRAALIFLCYLFVKQTIYLKGFSDVGVTVDKHGGGHVRMRAMEGVISWEWR